MDRLPKVRTDIQLIPAAIQGRQVVAVQDMLGLTSEAALLRPEMLQLLALFDGERSLGDLQLAMMRQRGNQLVMQAEVERFVAELDEALVLQTDRYRAKVEELRATFAGLDHRPPSHAGAAYPDDFRELTVMLEEVLGGTGGEASVEPHRIRALVAPHIDLNAGREAYAQAYAALEGISPQRLVVLGTGHSINQGLVSLTAKDYVTPLGRSPTDREAVRLLREAGGEILAPDDFAHRREHAIEFQMVFLQHLFGADIPVIPVLFGSLEPYLESAGRASAIPQLVPFLEALARLTDEGTLVVAGVDFCHVGPKFGHSEAASYYEQEFRNHDQALLDALCRGSASEFWGEGQRVQDRYHVCGFPVLACLLEILPGLEGRVLDHRVWHEDQTRSAVSFAAAVLFDPDYS